MRRLRIALVQQVSAALTAARIFARADLAAADEDVRLAKADLARARHAAARRAPDLTRERDARVERASGSYAVRRDAVTTALREAVAALPPAASAPWTRWIADPGGPGARGLAPDLLRIGALADEDVTCFVPLLDRCHLAVDGPDAAAADSLIASVLLRAIGSVPPGALRVSIFDPDGLGGALSGFAPLAAAGLVAFHGPGTLGGLLDTHVADVQRINESVLAGAHGSLRDAALATGRRAEPWRVLVLLGGGPDAQLERLARTGAACGVHLVTRGVPLPRDAATLVRLDAAGGATSSLTGPLRVRLDPPPPTSLVADTARLIADVALAGPAPTTLEDLLPEKFWTETSAYGLSTPLGRHTDGRLVDVTLADHPPHALIGGPSGSGKTNLVYAWLAGLTARYSPDELALYLLDFKEGVSFARFAPGPRDPSWLPHVRLAGVNINHDREFGLALLRFLAEELRRRAAAARAREVTKLAELRGEDPGGRWPRIVAVIDEFQVLLTGRDAITNESVTLLEDLARRGRSQGIHLVLASQDVAGIEALWGRGGLTAQFGLRLALPKARRILADSNVAAETLARRHAVVNDDGGAERANQVVRLADAGDRATWQALQHRMWRMRDPDAVPPRLFDGDAVPIFDEVTTGPGDEVRAVVGAAIDVVSRPATMTLTRSPGRHLAVLGTRVDDACAILASAARSAAATGSADDSTRPVPGRGETRPAVRDRPAAAIPAVVVACFDPAAEPAADRLVAAIPRAHRIGAGDLAAIDFPALVVIYAVDGAPAAVRAGLRDILTHGPERGVHVLGWWRTVARLREDLGGPAVRPDAIGAWVALDVHGSDLAPLSPTPGGPLWYPRARRALFFDRATHRVPEIVIPYDGAAG